MKGKPLLERVGKSLKRDWGVSCDGGSRGEKWGRRRYKYGILMVPPLTLRPIIYWVNAGVVRGLVDIGPTGARNCREGVSASPSRSHRRQIQKSTGGVGPWRFASRPGRPDQNPNPD